MRKKNEKLWFLDNVYKIINEKGLKQTFIAEEMNMDYHSFNNLLRGRRTVTALDIYNLSKILKVSADEILKK